MLHINTYSAFYFREIEMAFETPFVPRGLWWKFRAPGVKELFCTGCHRANFLNINRGGQTLPIPAHKRAPMRAFSVLQKRPKIAKLTPNDLLTPKMVFTEPLRKTEQNISLVS